VALEAEVDRGRVGPGQGAEVGPDRTRRVVAGAGTRSLGAGPRTGRVEADLGRERVAPKAEKRNRRLRGRGAGQAVVEEENLEANLNPHQIKANQEDLDHEVVLTEGDLEVNRTNLTRIKKRRKIFRCLVLAL